ncbi:MAG: GNAT family N-acetyltransferase [Phenylobacterium sp.]|nr:GNAT family N-acetyltransferase [Phenylobacterium sp.]
MTPTPVETLMQMSHELVRLFGYGPRAECRMLEHGCIALSGEAAADLNMAVLTGQASGDDLDEVLAAVRAKGVDALLVVEEGADAVRAMATEAGLTEVGQMPIMLRGPADVTPRSDFTVRIAAPEDADIGNRLAAEAFSLDEAMCAAATPAALLRAGAELWVAEEDGAPVGSGMFLRAGDQVGIYIMATPPAHQRRGVGRAVLETAMAHYQAGGVTRFMLGATEMGYPLYERSGFRTVLQPHVFVIGASTQFPGH